MVLPRVDKIVAQNGLGYYQKAHDFHAKVVVMCQSWCPTVVVAKATTIDHCGQTTDRGIPLRSEVSLTVVVKETASVVLKDKPLEKIAS